MNNLKQIIAVLLGIVLLYATPVSTVQAAGCSNLIGSVVFNEINHHNQSCNYSYDPSTFVELRALDNTIITNNTFQDFTMTLCTVYPQIEDNSSKPRCYSSNPTVGFGVGATGTNPEIIYQPSMKFSNAENSGNAWIVLYGDAGTIPKCYLDINKDQGNTSHGMELILYDINGDIVDYQLTDDMNEFSGVNTNYYLGAGSCTFPYDNYFDGAQSSFNVQRTPDGTGCWPDGNWSSNTCIGTPTSPPSGNSGTETTNTTNDVLPSGTTSVPLVVINDITVTPGGAATFTLSITGYYNLTTEVIDTTRTINEASSAIEINYMTIDGTATSASGDYDAVVGDYNTYASIPAGANSTTITINTHPTASVDEIFSVLLSGVRSSTTAPAIIYDFFGTATFLASVDHYAISHASPGVTCEASAITITPHNSSEQATAPSASTTITLATTPAADSWALKSGNGTFTPPNQYTFNGSETSVQFWLTKTTTATIDIDLSDGSATDIDNGGAEDLPIEFKNSAFRFYADSTADSIGNQIAGKPSGTAPGNQALTLRAVQTNTDTGACEAAITGTIPVNIAYECNNPTSCSASNLLSFTGTATQTISRNNNGTSPLSYTPVNMTFDASGTAPFSLTYSDAGQITLHATKDIAASSPNPAFSLTGSSNPFVVRPFGFDLDFANARATDWTNNGLLDGSGGDTSYAADATGSVYLAAGTNFDMTLSAVLWQAADDADGNGIPDSGANLTNNSNALNFGQEITSNSVLFSHLLDVSMPAGSNSGSLSSTPISAGGTTSFTTGAATTTLSWSEVGIIDITATLNSYLGSGANISGSAANVGRFIPNNFGLSLPSITDRVVSGYPAPGFTYMDEDLALNFTVSALNTSGGLTTNYLGNFAKWSGSGVSAYDSATPATYTVGAISGTTNLSSRLQITSSALTSTWSSGTVNANIQLNLTKPSSPDGPYITDFGVNFNDSDGVKLASLDLDVDSTTLPTPDHKYIGQTSLRLGRAVLGDASGSSTLGTLLSIPLTMEYYGATGTFIKNTDDTFTTISSTHLSCTDPNLSDSLNCLVPTVASVGNGGAYTITADGNSGTLLYTLDLTAASGANLEYLMYDWDTNTTDDNPSATITLGQYPDYHGEGRFRFWVEGN